MKNNQYSSVWIQIYMIFNVKLIITIKIVMKNP